MNLSRTKIDCIVEMAWADHTPFEAIAVQFGCSEADCIQLMRKVLKPSSFRLWRRRVSGRQSKHGKRSATQQRSAKVQVQYIWSEEV